MGLFHPVMGPFCPREARPRSRGSGWSAPVLSTAYRIETEQDEQRDGSQTAAFPLVQRHGTVGVVVDLNHHVFKYLHNTHVHAISLITDIPASQYQ